MLKAWLSRRPSGLGIAAVLLLLATPVSKPVRAADDPFSAEQKAELGLIIKDYLIKNPEVVRDAMVELDRRDQLAAIEQQKKALASVSDMLVNSERSIVLGSPDGDVTLVEFFDYNCGYCKRAMADLQALLKNDPKLRVVLRDFPVLGAESVEASMVAIAVANQLKGTRYLDYHARLMESRGRIGKERAVQLAKELGVDMAKLEKDISGTETRLALEETMRIADQLKIRGTPAFVIGDEVVFGAVGRDPLAKAIESVRSCGKTTC
ncbi:MAG: DsbA family protein [Hyphomicrobiales bacterium]